MPKVDRTQFHYSVTLYIERREVLYAVRGLSMAAQREVNNKIPWSGATDDAWHQARRVAKFHFTSQEIRTQFLEWIAELLAPRTLQQLETRDDDPATT